MMDRLMERTAVKKPRAKRMRLSSVANSIRLTKAFGSTPETWLRMQIAYDLAAARKNESKIKVRRQPIP